MNFWIGLIWWSRSLSIMIPLNVNSDTSPTLHTFKHVKRIDELDFTYVPLSKKKLKKLKKQNQIAKQASDIGGSNLMSNG